LLPAILFLVFNNDFHDLRDYERLMMRTFLPAWPMRMLAFQVLCIFCRIKLTTTGDDGHTAVLKDCIFISKILGSSAMDCILHFILSTRAEVRGCIVKLSLAVRNLWCAECAAWQQNPRTDIKKMH
jgi:hypothetical protein